MDGVEPKSACFEGGKIGVRKIVAPIFEESRNTLIVVFSAAMIQ